MNDEMKRNSVMAVAVIVALLSVTACLPAKAGARCRTTEWGQDRSHVLQCVNGRWKRVMTRQQAIDAIIAIHEASKRPAQGDVVNPSTLGTPQVTNLADPTVFVEGAATYIYGTSNYRRLPVIAVGDVNNFSPNQHAAEALGAPVPWASNAEIWAPTVSKIGGRYVAFFAAHRSGADPSNAQCVGRAFASSPLGPFFPDAGPFHCGNGGGALDPSIFHDHNGATHLLLTMGGSNQNLWSIPLDTNANIAGNPSLLLKREQPWQDWFLENPAMYHDGSTYLLAYSAGRWDQGSYMTGVARCSSPAGPCTDASRPWLASLGDREGPGGLEFFRGVDGVPRVAYQTYQAGLIGPVGMRHTHIRVLHTDPWPRLG